MNLKNKMLTIFSVFATVAASLPIISTPHPDMYLLASEICSKYGYVYTQYQVTTSDGYIL